MDSSAESEFLRVDHETVGSMEERLSKVQAELEAHRRSSSAELEAAMAFMAKRDTEASGVMEPEQAVAREMEVAASSIRDATSITSIPPEPKILHCQVWARFHECKHQSERMHKLCRPACKMASSGHLPLLDSSLEALLLLDVAGSQERVSFAPEVGRTLCQISQHMDGKDWVISRPAGSAFVPFDSMLHTLLNALCIKYEEREPADGPRLIKSNTRSGIPRVLNPIGRATSDEALGSYEYIAQLLAFVLGCAVLLLLLLRLAQGQRAKQPRRRRPNKRQ